MNSKIALLFLSVIFSACGVKKPPIPEESQPTVYEEYLGLKKSKEKAKKN